MKRAYGVGRKALVGQSQSRKPDYECPACDYRGRSDNVLQHMKLKSEFDSSGNPVHNIDQLSESKINHTKYFLDNNRTKKW